MCLLHWQVNSLPLSHQRSPLLVFKFFPQRWYFSDQKNLPKFSSFRELVCLVICFLFLLRWTFIIEEHFLGQDVLGTLGNPGIPHNQMGWADIHVWKLLPLSSPLPHRASPRAKFHSHDLLFEWEQRNTWFPWWLRWSSVCLQCRRPWFDSQVRKIPWRRKWQGNFPVLLPGKSHGQRILVGYSPWCCKESETTEQLHFQRNILNEWRKSGWWILYNKVLFIFLDHTPPPKETLKLFVFL